MMVGRSRLRLKQLKTPLALAGGVLFAPCAIQ